MDFKKATYIVGGIILWIVLFFVAISFYPITLTFLTIFLYSIVSDDLKNRLGGVGIAIFFGIYFLLLMVAFKLLGPSALSGLSDGQVCMNGYVCD